MGCLESFDGNSTEYYNEDLKLLKCKSGYILEERQCIPHCYSTCKTCSEYSENENYQKCNECKDNYIFEEGNCIKSPTTILVIPTTIKEIPTTVITPPTTVITPPTTIIIPPTTVIAPPLTTVITPPTTVISPPTTEIIPQTTLISPPTTLIIPTTTIISPSPTIQITEEKILDTCTNEKCLTCNEESDKDGLCLSCDESLYKKVNYTNKYSKYFNCF
ncbi:MAG: hypothetical protein J6O41_02240, partial [Clostridia bacterium]|nr:hypothetical protein [Clostridia bacterium]